MLYIYMCISIHIHIYIYMCVIKYCVFWCWQWSRNKQTGDKLWLIAIPKPVLGWANPGRYYTLYGAYTILWSYELPVAYPWKGLLESILYWFTWSNGWTKFQKQYCIYIYILHIKQYTRIEFNILYIYVCLIWRIPISNNYINIILNIYIYIYT